MITLHTPKTSNYTKKNFVSHIRMINLSLNALKLLTKSRDIKGFKEKSEEDLIKILSKLKPNINLSKKKIKEIEKDFRELRHRFSKSKINRFRRSLYNMKIRK